VQIIKKCDKAANITYYIAILIHIAIMCEGFSVWETPQRGRLLQIAFALCCIKILMTYYEKIEWIAIALIGAISIAGYVCSKEKYVVYVAVLIIAARNVDMKVVLSLVYYGVLISTILIAVFSLAGLGGTVSETRDYGRGIVETRYYLGFSHANNLHGTIWYIYALAAIIYKDRMDWKHYTLATFFNVGIYVLTGSRAGLVVAQLIIFACIAYTYLNKFVFEKLWIYILGFVALVATLVLTIISVSVDPIKGYGTVLTKINNALTNRLRLSYESAYIGDWHALTVGGSHKDTIDNGFASIPAAYGYIIGLLFVVFIVYIMYRTYKTKDGILFSVIVTTILYTFMESSYTVNDAYLLCNLMFIAAMILMGSKTNNEPEEHTA
jgi:hypothetical protein